MRYVHERPLFCQHVVLIYNAGSHPKANVYAGLLLPIVLKAVSLLLMCLSQSSIEPEPPHVDVRRLTKYLF